MCYHLFEQRGFRLFHQIFFFEGVNDFLVTNISRITFQVNKQGNKC